MNEHEQYITQALNYAKQNAVGTEGQVGAVLVRNSEVLAQGASNDSKGIHAEQDVLSGVNAEGATVYVTIQPSLYRSKESVPSDSEVLIKAGVAKVVVGSPNKKYPLEESTAFFAKHGVQFEVIQDESLANECLALFVSTGANQTPKFMASALMLVPFIQGASYTFTNF